MCPENVDKSSSTDCKSPISARTGPKKSTRASSGVAGIGIPSRAIRAQRPNNFNMTVLPDIRCE
jgi:hypothetical protein